MSNEYDYAEATPATEIVRRLKESMAESPGITEITVDGIRVKVDRSALDYWEKRAARETVPSTRPIASSINLSGF